MLVVSLDEVVEDHKEEEEDADDVGEHGELDVCDHRSLWLFVTSLKLEQMCVISIFGATEGGIC